MKFKKSKDFDNYVEEFKKLSLDEKKKLTIEEFKKIIVLFEKMNQENNNDTEVLFNREILDLNKTNSTEDDYVEAVLIYIYATQELIGNYIIKKGL